MAMIMAIIFSGAKLSETVLSRRDFQNLSAAEPDTPDAHNCYRLSHQ
jgi:hypothetical protein